MGTPDEPPHEDVDFLHVTYEVGALPATDTMMIRHHGREYGIVLSGRLGVQLGFKEYELGPGDSIRVRLHAAAPLLEPRRRAVNGIWCVVGRSG